MRKILYFFIALSLILSLFQTSAPSANAAINCTGLVEDAFSDPHWSPPSTKSRQTWFTINYPKDTTNMPKLLNAYIKYEKNEPQLIRDHGSLTQNPYEIKTDFDIYKNIPLPKGTIYMRWIQVFDTGIPGAWGIGSGDSGNYWRSGNYRLILVPKGKDLNDQVCSISFQVVPYCVIELKPNNNFEPPLKLSIKINSFNSQIKDNADHGVRIWKDGAIWKNLAENYPAKEFKDPGVALPDITSPGRYEVQVYNNGERLVDCRSNGFTVAEGGGYEGCLTNDQCAGDSVCLKDTDGDGIRTCGISDDYAPGKVPLACKEKTKEITHKDGSKETVGTGEFACQTAIGEINTDPNNFAKSILGLVLSLAGMILLAILILNGYKLMTSQGDPDKIKDAREGIIAAIAGVLLIIFSLSVLRFITVDIIGIPGFS